MTTFSVAELQFAIIFIFIDSGCLQSWNVFCFSYPHKSSGDYKFT